MNDHDFKRYQLEVTTGLDVWFTGRKLSTVTGGIEILTLYVTYSKNYVLHTEISRHFNSTESTVDIYTSIEDIYKRNPLNKLTKELLEKAGFKKLKYIS